MNQAVELERVGCFGITVIRKVPSMHGKATGQIDVDFIHEHDEAEISRAAIFMALKRLDLLDLNFLCN